MNIAEEWQQWALHTDAENPDYDSFLAGYNHRTLPPSSVIDSDAGVEEAMDQLMGFVRDIATNYDHDEDAHRYGTSCRMCDAQNILNHSKPSGEENIDECDTQPHAPDAKPVTVSAESLKEAVDDMTFEWVRRTLGYELIDHLAATYKNGLVIKGNG